MNITPVARKKKFPIRRALSGKYATMFRHARTQAERKALFRKLALQLHPNKNPGKNTSAEFASMTEAYRASNQQPPNRIRSDADIVPLTRTLIQHPVILKQLRRIVSPIIARVDRMAATPAAKPAAATQRTPAAPATAAKSAATQRRPRRPPTPTNYRGAARLQQLIGCIMLVLISMVFSYDATRFLFSVHRIQGSAMADAQLTIIMLAYVLTFLTIRNIQKLSRLMRHSKWLNTFKNRTELQRRTQYTMNSNTQLMTSMPAPLKQQVWDIAQYIDAAPKDTKFIDDTCQRFNISRDDLALLGKKVLGGPPPTRRVLGFLNPMDAGLVVALTMTGSKLSRFQGVLWSPKTAGQTKRGGAAMRDPMPGFFVPQNDNSATHYSNTLERAMYPNVAGALTRIGQQTRHGRGTVLHPNVAALQHQRVQFGSLNKMMGNAFKNAAEQRLVQMGITPHRSGPTGTPLAGIVRQLDPVAFKQQINRVRVAPPSSYYAPPNRHNAKLQAAWNSNMLAQRGIDEEYLVYEAMLIASGGDLCKSVAMVPKNVKKKNIAWFVDYRVGLLLDLTSAERRGMIHHVSDTNTYSGPGWPFAPACGVDTTVYPDVGYSRARQKMINYNARPHGAWSFSELNMDIDADSVLGVLFRVPDRDPKKIRLGLFDDEPLRAGVVWKLMNDLTLTGEKVAATFNVPNFLGVFYVMDPRTSAPARLRTYQDVLKYFSP